MNPDRTGNRSISACAIAATGTVVHPEGFGFVMAFRIVAPTGSTEHGITNDLEMTDVVRRTFAERAWQIEESHRGLKQATEVEGCLARLARSQRNYIGLALRAFVRLEWHRYSTGVSWFELVRSEVVDYPGRRSDLSVQPVVSVPNGANA